MIFINKINVITGKNNIDIKKSDSFLNSKKSFRYSRQVRIARGLEPIKCRKFFRKSILQKKHCSQISTFYVIQFDQETLSQMI